MTSNWRREVGRLDDAAFYYPLGYRWSFANTWCLTKLLHIKVPKVCISNVAPSGCDFSLQVIVLLIFFDESLSEGRSTCLGCCHHSPMRDVQVRVLTRLWKLLTSGLQNLIMKIKQWFKPVLYSSDSNQMLNKTDLTLYKHLNLNELWFSSSNQTWFFYFKCSTYLWLRWSSFN